MTVHEYDVVVVGAGVAGLSAACAAAESGARVAVVDRAPEAESGGNTRYTEAFLRMGSLDEVADGLEDTVVDDFMGHPDPSVVNEAALAHDRRSALYRAHHVVDPDYVAELAARAPETLAWMVGHGMRFDALPTPFLTTSTTRMAPVGGGLAILETMGKAARGLGVEFHFETTARSLLTSADGVVGVLAKGPGGAVRLYGRVVLASGGYQGNNELMARYHGDRAMTTRPVARGGNFNKGEGLEMALAVGAATAGNFSLFHAEPVDPRSGEPEAAIFCFPYGILVNTDGNRFVDEARGPIDAWYERTTRDIQAQTRGMGWVVLDQGSLRVPNIGSGIRTDQPPVRGATIAELAVRMGVPAAALEATVEAYNAACPEGHFDPLVPDGLATRGLVPAKSNWAQPLVEGPFVAYPIMAANVFTFGGLKTTAAAEVVDRDGSAIPGLWAAGEMTGLYYSNYTGSTSVLRGAVFGRIAGAAAARVGVPT
ncbi:FAD-dependent oxidoreductase [Aeromicrobium wangtongii]|uniref:FAD-dependent oxidoreductase n=1 Tax=Aeromicrobium wangtongii TaxID=2969247 RepID=A0ABY5M7K2_9ACTN|nr:FAD-dependent oxidoreductase [Aeromicrobium wangtongii]MCD9199821.1 FAD-dependent oxidoreductase [Aeromicrobium wangtongii]UUP13442.1 FAD-dependent oxidoreductase [Aeromicrobium wangtongii]